MPLEIRELEIRMRVGDTDSAAEGGAEAEDSRNGSTLPMDALVAECTRRVLQALEAKKDR
ncbi:MAG: hypothetical protein IPK82_00735 [Polyangiaceae bacterium]|nr:hypothetical protein [Polyangiaceae bacterium]